MRNCPQCNRSFGQQEFSVCPFDGAALEEGVSSADDPLVGRVLDGRFQIVQTIGRGGMGTVYKAVHTQMDRVCAVKLLSPMATDRESAAARFRREARLTSRIDSPNAVTIYDFGEAEPGLLYIAMEYIEGESLAEPLAREGSLAPQRVVSVTAQTADALAAAHSLGIVHRDLKPANIMLVRKGDEKEVVKVLDFGIAKSLTDSADDCLTQTGLLLGTPTYMSPEQVIGEGVDSRSDIYSLALIVYQMLSGRMPFEGENLRSLMMKRVNGEPMPLRAVAPSVTPAVERVVMSALSRDPEARIADARDFAAQLRNAFADSETPAAHLHAGVDGGGGKAGVSAPLEPAQLAPPAMAATQESPRTLSGTLLSPRRGRSTVEESRTTLAPQAPKSPDKIDAASWLSHASAAPAEGGAARRSKLSPLIIVAAVAFVAFAGALVSGGIYIYWRVSQATPSPASPQTASLTSLPDAGRQNAAQAADGLRPGASAAGGEGAGAGRTAEEYYRAGKSLQEQAGSLTLAGSRAAAAAKHEQAIEAYRRALNVKPDFPEARENLGVALYDLGRPDEAVPEYEAAIEQYRAPSSQVLTNYGMALFESTRYREAADAFSRALALQPEDAELHYYRGFALHYSGNRDGARAAFAAYLNAAPQGQHAKDVRDILAGRSAPSRKFGGR